MAKLFAALSLLSSILYPGYAHAADCNGLPISMPHEDWCNYLKRVEFKDQEDPKRDVSRLVADSMGLRDVPPAKIRSYAFVILVSKYAFADSKSPELAALAKEQADILKFVSDQGFDEAIVLEDEEATADLIRHIFTEYYWPQFSSGFDAEQKIRFMFIFDGHGWQPPTPESTGALALSKLDDQNDRDYDHRFSLAELRGLLQDLAPYTQSMVALINSCYSGSVFAGKPTADASVVSPAAWIATAVPGSDEAWVFEHDGSVFFQDLITSVNSWQPAQAILPAADPARGINLANYVPRLRQIIDFVNDMHQAKGGENPDTHKAYPAFIMDTVSNLGNRNGAYRFIVPRDFTNVSVTVPTLLNTGSVNRQVIVSLDKAPLTGSSLVGYPEVSILHTPEYYKIRGIDVSSKSGPVDFVKVRSAGIRFVYIKATDGDKVVNPTAFKRSHAAASASQLAVGAYHFFDYCKPAKSQIELVRSVIGDAKDLLPTAVILEWEFNKGKLVKPTECHDIAWARAELKKMLSAIEADTGKVPVIYTASSFSREFPILDQSFARYPLWIADYSKPAVETGNPKNVLNTPWTFWQIGDRAHLAGLPGEEFDLNIFFGSENDFTAFAAGKGNLALEAASGLSSNNRTNMFAPAPERLDVGPR